MSVIEPGPWWPSDRDVVDLGDVDAGAGGAGGVDAGGAVDAVTALEAGDVRVEAGGRQELDRGQHAAVDQAGLRCRAGRRCRSGRADPGARARCSCSLDISRTWPMVGFLAPGPKNGSTPAAR